jgi:hypothetical protein
MSALQQIILHPYLSQTVSPVLGSRSPRAALSLTFSLCFPRLDRPTPFFHPLRRCSIFFYLSAPLLVHDGRTRQDLPNRAVPGSIPGMVRVQEGSHKGDGRSSHQPEELAGPEQEA